MNSLRISAPQWWPFQKGGTGSVKGETNSATFWQGKVKTHRQWDVCKSPGFPGNRVAAGQVDPPAVRITMVCSLFACCLPASEAFLFLSGAVCWVFSNAYTKEEHLLVFFVASDRRRAGVTRRRRPLVDCATPPRHLSKKQKSKSSGLNNVPAWLKIYICVHGELFTGCAVRFAVKISQEYCASEQ